MLMSLFTMTWPERLGRTVQRWALAWGRIFYLGSVVLVLVEVGIHLKVIKIKLLKMIMIILLNLSS